MKISFFHKEKISTDGKELVVAMKKIVVLDTFDRFVSVLLFF